MFIPHEFPASSLRRGENELLVHIYPCVLEARKYPISAFAYSHKYNYESLVIRKAAHMFGWDICPRIVSAGLWRPVTLVEEKPVHIQDVYLWIDRMLENGAVKCTFAFDVELGLDEVLPYSLRVEGRCGDSAFQEETALWYTHGTGQLHAGKSPPVVAQRVRRARSVPDEGDPFPGGPGGGYAGMEAGSSDGSAAS